MMKATRRNRTMWFRGQLWGYIENGELVLSPESKLLLTKENNRRAILDAEISRLMPR